LRIAGAAGWAFMSLVAGQFIDRVGPEVIFVCSAGSLLAAWVLIPRSPEGEKEGLKEEFRNPTVGTQLLSLLQNRELLFLLFCVFLVSACGTTIWNFYSLYLKENGASARLVGFGLSFQGLCELPWFYFSALLIGRWGLRRTFLLCVLATALRLFLYSVVKNPILALPIELLHGVSWSLFWVAGVEYVDRLVRPEQRAGGQSLLNAAYYGSGALLGNLWTGYLYDQHLKLGTIFGLNAMVVSLIALVFALFFKRQREQHKV
jgi:MFS transporter, PPP family, 3-phenylpropionic acid transporter